MASKHSYEFRRARTRSKRAVALAEAQQDVGPASASETDRLKTHISDLWARIHLAFWNRIVTAYAEWRRRRMH